MSSSGRLIFLGGTIAKSSCLGERHLSAGCIGFCGRAVTETSKFACTNLIKLEIIKKVGSRQQHFHEQGVANEVSSFGLGSALVVS